MADLPAAPPVGQWVVNPSDLQVTLDLNLETALVNMGVPPSVATEKAARAFAYFYCTGLRARRAPADELVKRAYPAADFMATTGLGIAASSYCVDAV